MYRETQNFYAFSWLQNITLINRCTRFMSSVYTQTNFLFKKRVKKVFWVYIFILFNVIFIDLFLFFCFNFRVNNFKYHSFRSTLYELNLYTWYQKRKSSRRWYTWMVYILDGLWPGSMIVSSTINAMSTHVVPIHGTWKHFIVANMWESYLI